ncbi:MAG: RNA polymerase sigma factor [Ruminococcus sp.]|nr:RNA polymerase sigma factor [Ruminococcus sp.]
MAISEYEQSLVFAAKNGNEKCFEELYKLYYNKIYALALITMKNEADAEDVLQLTFINAWKYISQIEDVSAFNTWIQRITQNQCYSQLRKKKISVSIEDDENTEVLELESDFILPEAYADNADLSARLMKVIYNLSEVQRQTILLFYYEQLSVEEIAEVMNCSEGTVKSRLYLARKGIKTEIEEQERKSGQKFYGVAGLPVLPFSKIFVGQIQQSSLSQTAAAKIFAQISTSIHSVGAATAAAAGATGATAATVAVKTAATGITTKIIASVVAGIVVIGTASGVMITQHNKNRNSTEPTTAVTTAVTTAPPTETTTKATEPPTETVSLGEELFSNFSKPFSFASGVGAWGTDINISPDGSFEGSFRDSNMGGNAPEYPYGTVYASDFSGHFDNVKKINDYTYSMTMTDIKYKEKPDTKEISNGYRFIYTTAYGLEKAKTIYIYTPDAPVSKLPDRYLDDMSGVAFDYNQKTLGFYGLYNLKEKYGFFSDNK